MSEKRRGLFLAAGILLILYVLFSVLSNIRLVMTVLNAGAAEQTLLPQLPTLVIVLAQWALLVVLIVAAFLLWVGRPAERLLAGGIFGQAAVQGAAVLIQAGTVLRQSSLLLSGGIDLSTYWVTWGLDVLLTVLLVLLGLSLWGVLSRRWLLPTAVAGLVLMAVQSLINSGLPQFLQLNDIAYLRYILNTVLVVLLSCGVRIAILLIAIGLRQPKIKETE